jgi:hypothetical protein
VPADIYPQLNPLLRQGLEAESRGQATVEHDKRDIAASQRALVIASLLRCPASADRDADSNAERWS